QSIRRIVLRNELREASADIRLLVTDHHNHRDERHLRLAHRTMINDALRVRPCHVIPANVQPATSRPARGVTATGSRCVVAAIRSVAGTPLSTIAKRIPWVKSWNDGPQKGIHVPNSP